MTIHRTVEEAQTHAYKQGIVAGVEMTLEHLEASLPMDEAAVRDWIAAARANADQVKARDGL